MKYKIISFTNPFTIDQNTLLKGHPVVDYSRYLLDMPQVLKDINNIAAHFQKKGVTKIIGIADKGIIFAELIAHQLGLPLVVVGEGHKMPGQMLSIDIARANARIKYFQIFRGVIATDCEVYGVVDDITTTGETIYDTVKTLHDDRDESKSCGATFSFITKKDAWSPDFADVFKDNVYASSYTFQNGTLQPSMHTTQSAQPINTPNFKSYSLEELKAQILVYKNKLRGNILWTNFDHILANQHLMNSACDYMIRPFKDQKIDKVVALGVRGFHFGALAAKKLGVGLVLGEKRDRILSDNIESQFYGMEYEAQLEMAIQKGLINPGDRILIVDDILATGGTLNAAIELVEKFGATVVGTTCLIKINHVFDDPNIGGKIDTEKYKVNTPLAFSKQELEDKEKDYHKRIGNFIR